VGLEDIKRKHSMDLVKALLQYIVQGGGTAVIALLFGVVAFLVWDRVRLSKDLMDTTQKVYDAKDSENESIKEIVDRYHQGNLDLVQALNEIKIVLVTIQNIRK
jgi:hypothetical protein